MVRTTLLNDIYMADIYMANVNYVITQHRTVMCTVGGSTFNSFMSKRKKGVTTKTDHTFPAVLELMSTQVSAALSQKIPMVLCALWVSITGTLPYKAMGLKSSY